MNNDQIKPGWLKTWVVAIRPFSLPASTMPVIFGTAAAVVAGGARIELMPALLAFMAMVALHCGANVLSDVYDFRRGLDMQVTPVTGAVARGWITPRQALAGAGVLLALGAAIGAFLAWRCESAALWIIGGVGVLIGVCYSTPPVALKFHALGDLAVFLDFGILGALGAWTVQTGQPSWVPAIWAVPMSLQVIGILHANNWRDIAGDGEKDVRTIARLLGDRGSLGYYAFMLFAPFLIVAGLVMLRLAQPAAALGMPWTFAAVLLALPAALRCWGKARRRAAPAQPMDFLTLDGATAQFNLQFGLLCTAALMLHGLLAR
ncbi:MAG: prenyltransferase [Kiritimatiellaeota bacterium]|nr:prenyltransferase [Kiritimatiellota bacterium]